MVLKEYDTIMKNQFQQGIVDIIKPSENMIRVHYLPYYAVMRSDKDTMKICIVYDTFARRDHLSMTAYMLD